jgi:hypothetical protein
MKNLINAAHANERHFYWHENRDAKTGNSIISF